MDETQPARGDQADVAIEPGQDVREDLAAVGGRAGDERDRRGARRDVVREVARMHIDADTDDERLDDAPLKGRLDEDPRDLLPLDDDVVGPLDPDVPPGRRAGDRVSRGETRDERERGEARRGDT